MKKKETVRTVFIHAVLIAIVFVMMLPLISMFGTAFTAHDKVASQTSLLPAFGDWAVDNFTNILQKTNYGHNMLVSLIVSAAATALGAIVSTMGGYALARYKGPFFSLNLLMMLLMQMFPGMLVTIPLFMMFIKLNMVNHLSSIIIAYVGGNLGFNLMMMKSFYASIPEEIEEAGRIDGCSNFQVFTRIVLPLVKPGVATISIMVFLNAWNEYTMSSLLLRDEMVQTLTVGMTKFQTLDIIDWGYLMAASALAVLPALIFMFFAQKYLVQGLTSGSVKG